MLTVIDATIIQKVIAKLVTPTQQILLTGDYDGDSDITVLDAVKIQRDIAYGIN